MAEKKPRAKPKKKTMGWRDLMKTYTAQAATVLGAASAAYAVSDTLQAMISPTQFATAAGLGNAAIIFLRNIAQPNIGK